MKTHRKHSDLPFQANGNTYVRAWYFWNAFGTFLASDLWGDGQEKNRIEATSRDDSERQSTPINLTRLAWKKGSSAQRRNIPRRNTKTESGAQFLRVLGKALFHDEMGSGTTLLWGALKRNASVWRGFHCFVRAPDYRINPNSLKRCFSKHVRDLYRVMNLDTFIIFSSSSARSNRVWKMRAQNRSKGKVEGICVRYIYKQTGMRTRPSRVYSGLLY